MIKNLLERIKRMASDKNEKVIKNLGYISMLCMAANYSIGCVLVYFGIDYLLAALLMIFNTVMIKLLLKTKFSNKETFIYGIASEIVLYFFMQYIIYLASRNVDLYHFAQFTMLLMVINGIALALFTTSKVVRLIIGVTYVIAAGIFIIAAVLAFKN